MAENDSIELRYYAAAPGDAIAFTKAYTINLDGAPLTGSVLSAGFHINDGERPFLKLTLSDGLYWNDDTKVLTVTILNSQLRFIREDTEVNYEAFVVLDTNKLYTFREGSARAIRVG